MKWVLSVDSLTQCLGCFLFPLEFVKSGHFFKWRSEEEKRIISFMISFHNRSTLNIEILSEWVMTIARCHLSEVSGQGFRDDHPPTVHPPFCLRGAFLKKKKYFLTWNVHMSTIILYKGKLSRATKWFLSKSQMLLCLILYVEFFSSFFFSWTEKQQLMFRKLADYPTICHHSN